ncbi:carcinine hydrolase/isopenicillin-N N-acyltransferase family protein [Paenibacillus bouchesdurhonensis]|uniref:carcinine hydrolase/isopenicillin-N N-acyltransferase family protein n=1 Tax=Paenibacillus bouchesdurhonensis TaxID=1870990 RepID=UPI000DA62C29|nr:carcinine hydrolase/isopenicillin-N N-acyltransferase family protein [Paenibacillus bouchesdurhonensis]
MENRFIAYPGRPAVWRANYGSVTLSQVGRELPNGGINEAGLVVEQTTLWETEYPSPDHGSAVGELQWIQILLDSCGTVTQALEAASQIRISQGTSKLHFLLADRSGDWAVIEFLEGEMIIHKGEGLPSVLVNSLYKRGLKAPNSKTQATRYERNSLERMQKVRHLPKKFQLIKIPLPIPLIYCRLLEEKIRFTVLFMI